MPPRNNKKVLIKKLIKRPTFSFAGTELGTKYSEIKIRFIFGRVWARWTGPDSPPFR